MDRTTLRLEAVKLAMPRDIANPDMGLVFGRAKAIVDFVLDGEDLGDTGDAAPVKGTRIQVGSPRKSGHERQKLPLPGAD